LRHIAAWGLGRGALSYEWDWPKAEKEFQIVIALDSNDVNSHLAFARFLVAQKRREQAFVEVRKALELDPTSSTTEVSATNFYYLARDFDAAITQGKKTVELYPIRPRPTSGWLFPMDGRARKRRQSPLI
jgi:tetratricopeptide (TPR) repeat protein